MKYISKFKDLAGALTLADLNVWLWPFEFGWFLVNGDL